MKDNYTWYKTTTNAEANQSPIENVESVTPSQRLEYEDLGRIGKCSKNDTLDPLEEMVYPDALEIISRIKKLKTYDQEYMTRARRVSLIEVAKFESDMLFYSRAIELIKKVSMKMG